MGKNDINVNQWLEDEERFADLFNGFLFSGEQIIRPDELAPCDSRSQTLLPVVASKEKSAGRARSVRGRSIQTRSVQSRSVQRSRDIVKRWNRGVDLAILACENQDKIHYAMPVRTMIYDGLTYHDQIRKLRSQRKKNPKETDDTSRSLTSEEFLSHFRKDDKLIPCITLVFYYDEKTWDGALDLYDMFQIDPVFQDSEILKKYVPGYHVNLIDAGNISQLERFHTDLQQIFGVLQYRGKKEEIQKYIYDNSDYFQYIDKESYEALRVFMHSEKMLRDVDELKSRKEGTVDMCQALIELYQDGVNEGLETGRQEGLKAGRQEGLEAGRQEGLEAGRQEGLEEGRKEGLNAGRQEGLKAGRQEGLATGRIEGFENGQKQQTISIIVNMLTLHWSLPDIQASTMASDEVLAEAQELYRKGLSKS